MNTLMSILLQKYSQQLVILAFLLAFLFPALVRPLVAFPPSLTYAASVGGDLLRAAERIFLCAINLN